MRISAFITATPKYYSKLRIYEANYYSNTNFAECSFKHLDCLQSLRAFDLFFYFQNYGRILLHLCKALCIYDNDSPIDKIIFN